MNFKVLKMKFKSCGKIVKMFCCKIRFLQLIENLQESCDFSYFLPYVLFNVTVGFEK